MALLVTLFLVLVNIFNSVTGQAPKSEGLTAVETWVVMCILHVFCVLLEYAVILKIIQNEKRRIVAFRRAMAQQQYYAMAQIQGTNPPGQYSKWQVFRWASRTTALDPCLDKCPRHHKYSRGSTTSATDLVCQSFNKP